MTGEEMERAIEFLLKNQAEFYTRQAAFEERFEAEREQTNQQIRQLAEGHQQTREFLDDLSQIVAQNSRDIAQNSQQISHLGVVLTNVVEVQNRNNEEIDALIKLVGGLIEGRGNGKSGG
jgi:ABC-type transporter Mla subunit MlaD